MLTIYEQYYRDTYDPDFDEHYIYEQNPRYPKEDYEDFVVRMIDLKKSVIESIVKADKYMR